VVQGAAAEIGEPMEKADVGDLTADLVGSPQGTVGDPEVMIFRRRVPRAAPEIDFPGRAWEEVRATGRDLEIPADRTQEPGAWTRTVGAPERVAIMVVITREEPDSGSRTVRRSIHGQTVFADERCGVPEALLRGPQGGMIYAVVVD